MTFVLVALCILGLTGIVMGIVALRSNFRVSASRGTLVATLVVGVVVGLASWPLTYWIGYPFTNGGELGRIVGIPFFVAFFDSEGRDYVGPFTLPGVIGNCLFWFFVPQLLLRYAKRRSSKGVMA